MTALARLRRDLRATPERWHDAAAITALCMVTAAIAMMLRIPEAALSCYLIFFAWRDNSGAAIISGAILIVAASLALPLALPLLRLSVESPHWRLGLLTGLTLTGMTLAHASRAGPMIGTATFTFVFAITLYDVVPDPDLLTRGLAWMWVIVFVPMAVSILRAIFFGHSPYDQARALITRRRAACDRPDGAEARRLLAEGGTHMDGYLKMAGLMAHARGLRAAYLAAEAEASYLDLARAAAGLPQRAGPPAPAHPAQPAPLFTPGFLSDRAHLRFGVKVMIAVLITYLIYTLGGLFEIHTAMITCFFVALGTGAETRHKIALRITGAILGGLLGAAVLFALMPHLDDLGHLMAIVALGAFPAAWISLGSERISYAGWQLALCYFLVILGGFGPVTDPSAALNRVFGIAIGISVLWAVFTFLWPVSARDRIAALLDQFDVQIAQMAGYSLSGRAAMRLYATLAEAERLHSFVTYEGHDAPGEARQIAQARARLHRKLRHATGVNHA